MKNTIKGLIFTFGLCAGLVILAACSTSGQGGEADLAGPFWNLSSLMDQELVAGSSISIQFTTDGKVSGAAGCNRYSGAYTTSGKSLEIATPLATTMMACEQAVMDQETAYLKALAEVKTFAINGDQLTLNNADKQAILVYKMQSQDLSGTSWEVTGYNNGKQAVVSALADTSLTAVFGEDGNLSGSSGCNTYVGSYEVDGAAITIGPLASTMMACEQDVMDQETQFLAALQSAATYQVEGASLVLRTKDEAMAITAITSAPVE